MQSMQIPQVNVEAIISLLYIGLIVVSWEIIFWLISSAFPILCPGLNIP